MSDLERAFEMHHVAVFRFLLRMSGNPAMAEDLTQDTFLRAARMARSPFGWHADSERAWLLRVARNLMLNRRRDLERLPPNTPLEEVETAGVGVGNPLNRIALNEALKRLPVADREVILLRELGGLSHEEIAAVTESTVPAVRSRIHRARLSLRDSLRSRKTKEPRS